MKKMIAIVAMMALARAAVADSYAFTYQACLKDDKGEVIKEDGKVKKNLTVQIRLYDVATGGTALWGKAYSVLTDETGLFNLAITDSAGSSIDGVPSTTLESVFKKNQAGALFLGITVVGSSGEIVPRQCIYATPFASVANDVRAVSGDLTIGGNLTFGSGTQKVIISKDGITQEGGSATFQNLAVNGSAAIKDELTAGSGVFKADGSGVTVTDHPLNVVKTQLQIDGAEVVPVPVGGIIIWTKSSLPDATHWAICDGSNGTPDLTARFVVGAGNGSDNGNYALNDKGGAKTVTLTADQMPSHRHYYAGDDQLDGIAWRKDCTTVVCNTDSGYDADSTKSGNSRVYQTSATGGSAAHENRPPYYALYYIMRIK